MTDDEGKYCTICGGMVPGTSRVRTITVDGKAVGINGLDEILGQVASMEISRPEEVKMALLTAVKAANYVPTKKAGAYGDALYGEFMRYTGYGR